MYDTCPPWAPFFGYAVSAGSLLTPASPVSLALCVHNQYHGTGISLPQMIFTTIGAAYGTAKAGIGIAGVGQFK